MSSEQSNEDRPARPGVLLPRRRFFSEMPDKGLFGAVSILGFLGIILMKTNGAPANIVAGLSVALMMAYGVIAFRIPAVHIRVDRLGDNFYYLGFIFTLASLSAALVQLQTDMDVVSILGNFGIALVTTIVGIAGRVMFVQMRSELEDAEAIIRRDILAASAELKGQLSAALQDLETFRTAVRQSLGEDLKRSAEENKELIKQIGDIARLAADSTQAAFAQNQAYVRALNIVVTDTSKAIGDLIRQIEAVNVPGTLDGRLRVFTDALDSSARQLAAAVEAVRLAAGRPRRRRRIWRWLWPFGRVRQASPGE